MGSVAQHDEERVVVVAPTARDAQLSQALFAQAGLPCAICQDLATIGAELARGISVLVLTEEALAPERRQFLVAALMAQPTWSSLPVILLAGTASQRLLNAPLVQQLGNVLVLERPISTRTLLSVVQMAVHTRRRQYQARLVAEVGELLTAPADTVTLAAVVALLVPRLADCCILYINHDEALRVAAMAFAPEAEPAEARLRAVLADDGEPKLPVSFAEAGAEVPAALSEAATLAAGKALAETHLQIAGAAEHLCVPLEVQGRLLGVLSLGMLTSGRTFLPDECRVVQEVAGRLALALNQTWLYQAEQAARAQAEMAVRSRDELMALISHDLNNPLTVVRGQVQLLQRRLSNGPPMPEWVLHGIATIGRAAQQMQTQIAELLDVARGQAGQPAEVPRVVTDLVALTHTVVAAVQQGTERHHISVQTPLPALVAPVDPVRIARVLDNLLSNAVKYSPAGGRITVTIDVERVDAEAWALVQVQDQGIGIPADELPHIFERFRRASNVASVMPGTGLGLASARQIVEQYGGRITMESVENRGSLVTVHIPLRVAAQNHLCS